MSQDNEKDPAQEVDEQALTTEEESPVVNANRLLEYVAIETDQDQLTRQCEDVESEEEREELYTQLRAHMILLGEQALGLSAIQIGIPKRAFVVRVPRDDAPMRRSATIEEKFDFKLFVNAEVVRGRYEDRFTEQCLSIPMQSFDVNRFKRVVIRDDVNGEVEYRNKLARVIQHELDHTNGITLWQSGEPHRVETPPGTMSYEDIAQQVDERREMVRQMLEESERMIGETAKSPEEKVVAGASSDEEQGGSGSSEGDSGSGD